MNNTMQFCIRTAFGAESMLTGELRHLGYKDFQTENGKIRFTGGFLDCTALNARLRTASRIELILGEFPARDFDALFDGLSAIRWEEYFTADSCVTVLVKIKKSEINSVRSSQSISKKAIVKRLCEKYRVRRLEESGPQHTVMVEIENDIASVTLDSSGEGLHRRGYRKQQGLAPLRETAAAGILLALRWFGRDPLHDPFCGSGTIAIEAAMLAAGMAPQQQRGFAWQNWHFADRATAEAQLREIRAERKPCNTPIIASDIDPQMVAIARTNAAAAGVLDLIRFETADASTLEPMPGPGQIICNPPYGERLGDQESAAALYREFGSAWQHNRPQWDVAVLSAHPEFVQNFGRKPDKNRKIYNGKLMSYLYSYRGAKR